MENSGKKGYIEIIVSMIIFGTIGIFVKQIALPSGIIACARGLIGSLILLLFGFSSKRPFNVATVRPCLPLLAVSGAFIGLNWVLLFEAYNYVTVATATLCYYLNPIFIILASPLVLKEKLSPKKLVCVVIALVGMTLVSGIFGTENAGDRGYVGVILGISAAISYATVVLMNKKIPDNVSANDRTIVQLASAGIVIGIYSLLTNDIFAISADLTSALLLTLICVVHTGIAYALYFSSVKKLSAQTSAMFSYIDPIVAVTLSALVLGEKITVLTVIGAILILGSTFVGEINFKKPLA